MKKSNLVLLIMVLCVCLLAGCTKENTATLQQCCELYDSTTNLYSEDSSEKTIVFDKKGAVDLYSSSAYSSNLYNKIYNTVAEDYTIIELLKKGAQYQVLIECATNLFNNYKAYLYSETSLSKLDDVVEQEYKSNLYHHIDLLSANCDDLQSKKKSLEILCTGDIDIENSTNIKNNFQKYLSSYSTLIGNMFEINFATDKILTQYYLHKDGNLCDDKKYMSLSSNLYIAYYFYQKHFVYNENLTTDFANELVGTSENTNYDTLFGKFENILSKNINSSMTELAYSTQDTKLTSLKIDIQNYAFAVEKLNHKTTLSEDDENYSYYEYVMNFGVEVENFENYLLAYAYDA